VNAPGLRHRVVRRGARHSWRPWPASPAVSQCRSAYLATRPDRIGVGRESGGCGSATNVRVPSRRSVDRCSGPSASPSSGWDRDLVVSVVALTHRVAVDLACRLRGQWARTTPNGSSENR
jgi:hypothetical protein